MRISICYHVDKDDRFSSMVVPSKEGRESFVCLADQGGDLKIFLDKEDKEALRSFIEATRMALVKLDQISGDGSEKIEELTCQALDMG